jgi:hypothetical protein
MKLVTLAGLYEDKGRRIYNPSATVANRSKERGELEKKS